MKTYAYYTTLYGNRNFQTMEDLALSSLKLDKYEALKNNFLRRTEKYDEKNYFESNKVVGDF